MMVFRIKQVLTPYQFFAVELENTKDLIIIASKIGKPVLEDDERLFVIDNTVVYWVKK